MSKVDIEALLRLEAAATAGKWTAYLGEYCGVNPVRACGIRTERSEYANVFGSDSHDECSHPISRDDAEFIAAFRNAAPYLLDELADLRKIADLWSRVPEDVRERVVSQALTPEEHRIGERIAALPDVTEPRPGWQADVERHNARAEALEWFHAEVHHISVSDDYNAMTGWVAIAALYSDERYTPLEAAKPEPKS